MKTQPLTVFLCISSSPKLDILYITFHLYFPPQWYFSGNIPISLLIHSPPPPFLTECLSSAWSRLQFLRKSTSPNFISFLFSHFPHWNLKSPYKSNPLIGLKMRILYSSLITMNSLNYPKFIFSYSMSISSANLVDSTLEILPIFISNLLLSSTTNTRTKGNVI